MDQETDPVFAPRARPILTAVGAGAGLSLWLLAEIVPDILDDRGLLAVSVLAAGLFISLLLLTGPVPLLRAIPVALGLGGVAAVLAVLGSLRFADVQDFISTGHPVLALAIVILISLPFAAAALLPGRPWRSYAVLFDLAWAGFIRALAAALFLGLVWLFLWLSEAVLNLVDLAFLDAFVGAGPAPFVLSGAIVGLGLAVAGEFGAVLAPALPLGLLRLMLPPAVAVMGLFILVLPFRGVSNAFGTLSAAGVLMVMALTGTALVSAVVDRSDAQASQSRLLRIGARVMAGLIAVFSGLAIYAIVLRVTQYGWSPDRVLAMLTACVLAGYGLGYVIAQLTATRWMSTMRAVNVLVALPAIGAAVLSLTPVLNPQKIGAEAQVARYQAGRTGAEDLDLWSMDRDWGLAGRAAIARLRALAPDDPELASRFDALDAAGSRFAFENGGAAGRRAVALEQFLGAVATLPEGNTLNAPMLSDVPLRNLESWASACARRTPGGNSGCAVFSGDFTGLGDAPQHVLFLLEQDGIVRSQLLQRAETPSGRFGPTWLTMDYARTTDPGLIDDLIAGRASLEPLTLRALRFDGADLLILP